MHPDDLRYHKKHIWIKVNGNKAIVGITSYAQESLGEIIYVDLPDVEMEVEADEEFAEIESTKATFSVTSPINGVVMEINEELSESPEIINEDPYGKGWIAVIEIEDDSGLDTLIDAAEYEIYLRKEKRLK
ncbi:MAG: glycine cleavage system protein GcvH [Nitrospirae bacterium]|nr:glycine cleavage system protein GcvH [Nitrospirota bacterium]